MFIPSESIFSQINTYGDLIDYAFNKKVIIASPSILLTILNSVDYYFQIFESVRNTEQTLKCINDVMKAIDNFDKGFTQKLKNKLKEAIKEIDDIFTKGKTLKQRYKKLEQASEEEKEHFQH